MKFSIKVKVKRREDWIATVMEVLEGSYNLPHLKHQDIQNFQDGSILLVTGKITNNRITYESFEVFKHGPSPEGHWIGDEFVRNDIYRMFEHVDARLSNGAVAVNIMAQGPSGYGKTSLGHAYGNWKDIPVMIMPCGTMVDPQDWFGFWQASKGSTKFVESRFIQFIQEGNGVCILDEANRLPPNVLNSLFQLLDYNREMTFFDRTFKVGKGLLFLATVNRGYQYTGTFSMDAAWRNRMQGTVDVGALPAHIEAEVLVRKVGVESTDAETIVDTMTYFREQQDMPQDIDYSTRGSLNVARWWHAGCDMRSAFEWVVTRQIGSDQSRRREPIITYLNRRFGIYNA